MHFKQICWSVCGRCGWDWFIAKYIPFAWKDAQRRRASSNGQRAARSHILAAFWLKGKKLLGKYSFALIPIWVWRTRHVQRRTAARQRKAQICYFCRLNLNLSGSIRKHSQNKMDTSKIRKIMLILCEFSEELREYAIQLLLSRFPYSKSAEFDLNYYYWNARFLFMSFWKCLPISSEFSSFSSLNLSIIASVSNPWTFLIIFHVFICM